ncbi:hypothetical protein QFZ53_002482 [Microbacterium natoriense]|uniref:Uncharacterized protein n=1 Tax=Microbacterium natoriense TaxID=284570 RepID=A0AAW8F1D1_9MICO|nr:DUF4265 domain-containing protein [Microbacterium natoriense]MDQ0648286.1 hypothetical protein [Microbacterium natoriense]
MPIHRRHPAIAGEWSGRELVPSRLAAEADTEVWLALPPEGSGEQMWEALNGLFVGPGIVEIRAVPALAYDVAFGDRVSIVRSAEGSPVVNGIHERGPFGTFRLWLGESVNLTSSWRSVAEKYAELGCLVDVYSEKLIAIACPGNRAVRIREILEAQASESELIWEESSLSPPTD